MKRIAGLLAALVVVVVALFSLLLVLLPREAVKTQVGQQIAAWTGREVSLRGEPQIDFFPRLTVTLNDVTVSGPSRMTDAEVLSMDRLTGAIRLAPLVIGRVEIESYEMVRPVVRLIRDEEGRRNWEFDSGAAALQLAFAGDVPLGVFRLEGGSVIYEDRQTGEVDRVDSLDITVDWSSVRSPLSVAGSGIWRGEQVAVSAGASAPFSFINGRATPFEVRIESTPISMIFSGEAADYPWPRLSGPLKLSTPSLRRFANWLGSPIGSGSIPGQASLFGAAEFRDGVLSVADAEVTLDGNSASGALNVSAAARPDVTGTLAFGTLDLTPYFAGLGQALTSASDWRGVTLPTDWFGDLSADVRLSANAVKVGALTTGAVAASVSLKDERLEIGLAQAVLNGGSLAGDLEIADGEEPLVEAKLRVSDVDLARIGGALGLAQSLAGRGSGTVDLVTRGRDLGAMLDGLDGTARLEVRDGAVPLFGIARAAAAAGVAADPGPMEPLSPVQVSAASAGLSFSNGVAVLERARLTAGSYSSEAQGWIGLRDGTLGLNGSIWEGAAGPSEDTAFPFVVEGTLSGPEARLLALEN